MSDVVSVSFPRDSASEARRANAARRNARRPEPVREAQRPAGAQTLHERLRDRTLVAGRPVPAPAEPPQPVTIGSNQPNPASQARSREPKRAGVPGGQAWSSAVPFTLLAAVAISLMVLSLPRPGGDVGEPKFSLRLEGQPVRAEPPAPAVAPAAAIAPVVVAPVPQPVAKSMAVPAEPVLAPAPALDAKRVIPADKMVDFTSRVTVPAKAAQVVVPEPVKSAVAPLLSQPAAPVAASEGAVASARAPTPAPVVPIEPAARSTIVAPQAVAAAASAALAGTPPVVEPVSAASAPATAVPAPVPAAKTSKSQKTKAKAKAAVEPEPKPAKIQAAKPAPAKPRKKIAKVPAFSRTKELR